MSNWILQLWELFQLWRAGKTTTPVVPVTPAPVVPPAPAPTPIPAPVPVTALLFDTPQNARHSVRVLCDNAGLSLVPNVKVQGVLYLAKDIICACIEIESQFYNYLPSGKPTIHQNIVDGKVSSTDWGICQINDYFHIGKGKDFPSADYVMANPDKAVQFMINCFKAGKLNLWVSYSSGEYIKHLPQNAQLAGRN